MQFYGVFPNDGQRSRYYTSKTVEKCNFRPHKQRPLLAVLHSVGTAIRDSLLILLGEESGGWSD